MPISKTRQISRLAQDVMSIRDFGAVGDGTTINTAAFAEAEASNVNYLFVPEGSFRVGQTSLKKQYFGPGSIIFPDGYIQNCALQRVERPRDETGPVVISSQNDVTFDLPGTINANGARITGLKQAVSDDDALSMRKLASGVPTVKTPDAIVDRVAFSNTASLDAKTLDWYEEGLFTPVVSGDPSLGTDIGTTTYQYRYGRFVRIGNQCRVRVVVSFQITGTTFPVVVTDLPFLAKTENTPTFVSAGIGSGVVANQDIVGNYGFYVANNKVSTSSAISGSIYYFNVASGQLPGNSNDYTAIWDIDVTYDVAE